MECFAVQHPLNGSKKLNSNWLIEQFKFDEPVYLFREKTKLEAALNHNFLNLSEKERYVIYQVDVEGTFTTAKVKLQNHETLGGRKGNIYKIIPVDMTHFELKSAYDWSKPDTVYEFSLNAKQKSTRRAGSNKKRRTIKTPKVSSHKLAKEIVDTMANKPSDENLFTKELIHLTTKIEREEPVERNTVTLKSSNKSKNKATKVKTKSEQLASNDSMQNMSSYTIRVQAAFVTASVGLTAATIWLVGGVPVLSSTMTAIGIPSSAFALDIFVTLGASSLLVALAIGAWKLSSKLSQSINSKSHNPSIIEQAQVETFSISTLHLALNNRSLLNEEGVQEKSFEGWKLANDTNNLCFSFNPSTLKNKSADIVDLNKKRADRQLNKVR